MGTAPPCLPGWWECFEGGMLMALPRRSCSAAIQTHRCHPNELFHPN